MLKSSKGLAIGLTALTVIGVAVFFLLKASPSMADTTAATPAIAATPDKPSALVPAAPAAAAASTPAATPASAASKIDVAAAMKDRFIGKDSAPVTIIEYASLTCPHCAHFEKELLPAVKAQLLDTGKAKLVFRDFPLDGFALKAAMMARCVSPLQYFNMIEVLFAQQETWTKAKDPLPELEKIGSLAGMDAADFKSCTENKDLENAILAGMKDAQNKYKVESTPTFIFNDGADQFTGAYDVGKFVATVNKLTMAKGK